ncbi:hypothetical protein RIR_jg31096.t1 [Rhizophagus irregularis DAOM 181602=DAOM 197198]|nr:hypothetical protein RIR_jg31096.t1 [Rhizophagus irregularis DAOM 181602=DAOM 197198]
MSDTGVVNQLPMNRYIDTQTCINANLNNNLVYGNKMNVGLYLDEKLTNNSPEDAEITSKHLEMINHENLMALEL